jgi:hypothetical protein
MRAKKRLNPEQAVERANFYRLLKSVSPDSAFLNRQTRLLINHVAGLDCCDKLYNAEGYRRKLALYDAVLLQTANPEDCKTKAMDVVDHIRDYVRKNDHTYNDV